MAHGMPDPENPEKGSATRGQWFSIAQLLLEVAYGIPPDRLQEDVQAGAEFPRELNGRGREEVEAFVVHGVREALAGDTAEARRVLRRLEALRDEGTSRTFEAAFEPWFALMDAGPAFRRGDWASVVQRLEPLGARIQDPGVGFMAGDAYLIWWMLAEAHQRSGHTALAIPYLELLLRRPTFGLQDWSLQGFIHPAARYKLAGLYGDVGNPEKAREHYRIFLATFTDPDPDLRWMVEEAGRALYMKPSR